ncbi:hypothetical protein B9Z55_021470 [Caenorhabditis nigoni]|uniref:SCP domain-containing protein n=1 Tax=Caenorhabditis nigoni TaxID=1611254 RepID=A0A2G5TS87_9PELO|nr:hypothetical protein B9Z55_021470 [Caenorhabditis nigoni]
MNLVWILLLIACSIVVVDSISDEQMKEKYLPYFNKERTKHATSNIFGNMWKLEWSTELAEKVKELPKDCKTLKRNGYRFLLMKNDLNDPAWSEWGNFEQMYRYNFWPEGYVESKTLHTIEMWIAGQKRVGCGAYACSKYPSNNPRSNKTMDFEVICLFGPVIEVDKSMGLKDGKPGSKCAEDGGKNEDGLCVPKDAPSSSNAVDTSSNGAQTNTNGAHMIREIPILALIVFWIFNFFKQ